MHDLRQEGEGNRGVAMTMHRLRVILGEELDDVVDGAEFVAGDGVEDVEFIGGVEDAVEAAADGGEVHDICYRRA